MESLKQKIKPSEFIETVTDDSAVAANEATELISKASYRRLLYSELNDSLSPSHAPLLRKLLQQDMEDRQKATNEDIFENICWCGLLLYRIGDVNDSTLLWDAKNTDFDTYCGFDIQYLVGAGIDDTIEHLKLQQDEKSKEALHYIMECKNSGDFDELDSWLEFKMNYFK